MSATIEGKKIKYIYPRIPKSKVGTSAKAVKQAAEKASTDSNKTRVIRRQVVRMAQHLHKTIDYAFAARKSAYRMKRLDSVESYTEIIASCKVSLAYLDSISKHYFLKSLEQLLKSYK